MSYSLPIVPGWIGSIMTEVRHYSLLYRSQVVSASLLFCRRVELQGVEVVRLWHAITAVGDSYEWRKLNQRA